MQPAGGQERDGTLDLKQIYDPLVSEQENRKKILDFLMSAPKSGGPSGLTEIVLALFEKTARLEAELLELRSEAFAVSGIHLLEEFLVAETPESCNPPKRLSLVASEKWDADDGFHFLEWTEEGLPYRWVGPSRFFRFSAELDRTEEVGARLAIVAHIPDLSLKDIICRVDGARTPIRADQSTLEVVVPRSRHNRVVLDYEVPLVSPAAPPDERMLSVAVNSLLLAPLNAAAAE